MFKVADVRFKKKMLTHHTRGIFYQEFHKNSFFEEIVLFYFLKTRLSGYNLKNHFSKYTFCFYSLFIKIQK